LKLVYTSDNYFFQTNDGRFWSSTSFPIDFILKKLPEISHWTFWGRIKKVDDSSSLYLLPDKVNGCLVSYAGPLVKRRNQLLWPLWIAKSFLSFKRELASADIIFLKMPYLFSCIASYMLRKGQVIISQQVGDPAATIPLMMPKLKLLGSVIARYCEKVASRADRAFFVSNALRNIYGDIQRGDIVCNESRVTIDMIVENPGILPHHPARIIFVGRLSIEKGLEVLLQAIAEVKKDIAVELWIIGEGPFKSPLKRLAGTLGVTDDIKWLGRLRWGSQLFEKIAEADTLVLPSYSEGLGLVLIEGMSQGLLTIGSSVGGIPEVLDDGKCGILVPPGDYKALAAAIKFSVTNITFRRSLIEKGLAKAKENCLENQAGVLASNIHRLIEAQKRT